MSNESDFIIITAARPGVWMREKFTPGGWGRMIGETFSPDYREKMDLMRDVDDRINEWTENFKLDIKEIKHSFKAGRVIDTAVLLTRLNNKFKKVNEIGSELEAAYKSVLEEMEKETEQFYPEEMEEFHKSLKGKKSELEVDELIANAGLRDWARSLVLKRLDRENRKKRDFAIRTVISMAERIIMAIQYEIRKMGVARAKGDLGAYMNSLSRVAIKQQEFENHFVPVYTEHLKPLVDAAIERATGKSEKEKKLVENQKLLTEKGIVSKWSEEGQPQDHLRESLESIRGLMSKKSVDKGMLGQDMLKLIKDTAKAYGMDEGVINEIVNEFLVSLEASKVKSSVKPDVVEVPGEKPVEVVAPAVEQPKVPALVPESTPIPAPQNEVVVQPEDRGASVTPTPSPLPSTPAPAPVTTPAKPKAKPVRHQPTKMMSSEIMRELAKAERAKAQKKTVEQVPGIPMQASEIIEQFAKLAIVRDNVGTDVLDESPDNQVVDLAIGMFVHDRDEEDYYSKDFEFYQLQSKERARYLYKAMELVNESRPDSTRDSENILENSENLNEAEKLELSAKKIFKADKMEGHAKYREVTWNTLPPEERDFYRKEAIKLIHSNVNPDSFPVNNMDLTEEEAAATIPRSHMPRTLHEKESPITKMDIASEFVSPEATDINIRQNRISNVMADNLPKPEEELYFPGNFELTEDEKRMKKELAKETAAISRKLSTDKAFLHILTKLASLNDPNVMATFILKYAAKIEDQDLDASLKLTSIAEGILNG